MLGRGKKKERGGRTIHLTVPVEIYLAEGAVRGCDEWLENTVGCWTRLRSL